jgi:hypothetical protein
MFPPVCVSDAHCLNSGNRVAGENSSNATNPGMGGNATSTGPGRPQRNYMRSQEFLEGVMKIRWNIVGEVLNLQLEVSNIKCFKARGV